MSGRGPAAFAFSIVSNQVPGHRLEGKSKLHGCYHGTADINTVDMSTVDVSGASRLLA